MTVFLWAACLVLVMAPFYPALREWRTRSDAAPLTVIQNHHGQLNYFATEFRHLLTRDLGQSLSAWVAQNRDNDQALIVPNSGAEKKRGIVLSVGGRYPGDISEAIAQTLSKKAPRSLSVVACGNTRLRQAARTSADVYAAGDVLLSADSELRAITADGHLAIESRATVLRWADALTVAAYPQALLPGRLTAQRGIALSMGVRFHRLQAPVVRIERSISSQTPAQAFATSSNTGNETEAPVIRATAAPDGLAGGAARRWYSKEDIEVAPGQVHKGDIVTKGKLVIRRGARVSGAVKAHRGIVVESDVRIEGAAVSDSSFSIEKGAYLSGPLIADQTLDIQGGGTVIGSPRMHTTVIARRITLHPGLTLHGLISAYESGEVIETAGAVQGRPAAPNRPLPATAAS